jgi:predicted nucleic acid-binding protein
MLLILLPDDFPVGPLVLDSSAIFNLLGCGKPVEVVQALGVSCLIEERTLAEIKRHPVSGMCHKEVLSALMQKAKVETYRMSAEEYDLYLTLVSGKPSECLGDGESAAIAAAVFQKRAVILDDGKARRIHGSRFATTPVASSLRMFLAAGKLQRWKTEHIRELIYAAQLNARMNIVKSEAGLFASLGE